MSFFDGIIGPIVQTIGHAFAGSAAKTIGHKAAVALFPDDKKSTTTTTTTAAPTGPTVAPGTPYSQVDPLKGLENEKIPQGVGGFMGSLTVRPPRSKEQFNPYLTEGLHLLQSVMKEPPASPKMVQEISVASAAGKITSSGSSRKAIQKLFKT